MLCHNCHQENAETNRFCIHCGTTFSGGAEEEGRAVSGDVRPEPRPALTVAGLQRQVEALRREIGAIRTTLADSGMTVPPVAEPAPPPTAPETAGPPPAAVQPVPVTVWRPPETEQVPPLEGQETAMPWDRVQVDWEAVLGGNWMARIGVLAMIFGMAFFFKLAVDNNWINELGRVVLGVAAGAVSLGASQYWIRRYPVYAQALAGGGVALLYLSVFAAFARYDLIDFYPAVGLLFLISVGSAGLALGHNSIALAIIGIAGAFSAPFIIGGFATDSTGVKAAGESGQLIGYIIAVDVGVLALSTVRNWRWFTLLALLGSLSAFGAWYGQYGDAVSLLISEGGYTIIFLIFVGATTLFHVIWRREPRAFDYSLISINAAAYFGITYGLLWDEYRDWMGAITLAMSLFYGGVAYAAFARTRAHPYLTLMNLGIALVLLTVAVPVQFQGPWVSVAWAAQATVLLWLSFRTGAREMRYFSLAVYAVSAYWLLYVETAEALDADFTPFLNKYFPAYLASMAAAYLAVYLFRRYKDALPESEYMLIPIFLVAGNVVLTLTMPVQLEGAWIAVAWAAEGLVLVALAFRIRIADLRWFGYAVLSTMAAYLMLSSNVDLSEFDIILNHRMMGFVSGIAALYLSAYLVHLRIASLQPWEKESAVPALVLVANFLTLWILSAEVIAAVDSGIIEVTGQTAFYVKSLSLSLLWAVYASLAVILGALKRWRTVRLGGLGLLTIPILKLFLVDSFALEREYRVIAFLSLGAILLIGAYLYQRYRTTIKDFLFEERQPAAAQ